MRPWGVPIGHVSTIHNRLCLANFCNVSHVPINPLLDLAQCLKPLSTGLEINDIQLQAELYNLYEERISLKR